MNAIELKELYLKLKEREVNLDLLEEADHLRMEASRAGNDEYYLRGTALILDIFTQGDDSLLDDALKLGVDNYELARSYSDKYPDMYKDYLLHLSYIYITKQLYQQALSIETERKNYLDPNDNNEVNRWQLELAYIYNAIDEKNEALRKFQAILLNNPDNETKSVCLSNLAQLYIEAHDFDNAKKTLEENYRFAKTINDEEGIRYINCLKGKIYHLQNDYKNSYNTLYPLIRDINELNIENFNYLNEFISLLIDMGRLNEGFVLVNKYYEEVGNSFDLADKLTFYKNALKLEVELTNKKKRGSLFDSTSLLDMISSLEKEIQKNKEIKASKVRESEFDLDSFNKERVITNKIKDNLLKINCNSHESLRDFLITFGKSLVEVIPMEEVLVVLFDKTLNQDLSVMPFKEELITTYQYKNNRLYERKLTYNVLDKTIISEIINNNKVLALDYAKNNYAYVNPFTNDFYANEKVKYLLGYPLVSNDNVFGEIIYLSKSNNILDYYNNAILDITTSLFNASLKNMLYVENNNLEHQLYSAITKATKFGVFYYSNETKTYIISDALKELIGVNKSELSVDSFNDLVLKSDFNNYVSKFALINEKKDYDINYHLLINGESTLVMEKGVAAEIGETLYYVGTIMKIDLDKNVVKELNDEVLDLNSLNEELERRRDKKFTAIALLGNKNLEFAKRLQMELSTSVYFHNGVYYLLFNDTIKEISVLIKIHKDLFKNNYTIVEYPGVLVRLDDFVEVCNYVLNTATTLYTTFTNELYATYISINTIESMVNRAISEDKISKLSQAVTLDNQFVGYVFTPNIPGVFDLNNLRVVGNKTISLLDKYMVKGLANEENITIYSLSLESLLDISCANYLQKSSKVVFNINKYNNPALINEVIKQLIDTKCRIIINFELFKNISLDNIMNYSDVIFAFTNDLSSEERDLAKKFVSNYYEFDSLEGFKVSKAIAKK